MAMVKSLLDDGDDDGIVAELKVNEQYARRFEHNKKREDLHRLEELQKQGLVVNSESESDSEEEEEDENGVLPDKTEVQILDTLVKIRKRDPVIYSKGVKFYDDDEEENEQKGEDELAKGKGKGTPKGVYLKDVVAKQLLEDGPEGEDLESISKRKDKAKRNLLSYAEEQMQLKQAFLQSVADADSDSEDVGGLLKIRKKSKEELDKEKKETDEVIAEFEQKKKDVDINRRLEEYFGRDNELDENEKFLKDYLLNQGWVDKDQNRIPSYGEIVDDISEDEKELEKQDKYEADYNFRFEEGAGNQVLGHSRIIDDSVRKKSDARKKQRKQKQDRAQEAALARQEELKRLKNVKKRELMEKLSKIKTVAGAGSLDVLDEQDLEEDFDPEEYDRKMHEAFGVGYYEAEDVDANFCAGDEDGDIEDMVKPDFDVEDELLGLPKGWDDHTSVGFAAARMKQKQKLAGINDEERHDEVNENFKVSLAQKLALEKQLEEYYKLDYEDMIGDLPTRFKYKKLKPNMYGLTPEEILTTDDAELNQYVSIKRLAPYRTEEWKVPKYNRLSKKDRKRKSMDQTPMLTNKKSKTKHQNAVSKSCDNDPVVADDSNKPVCSRMVDSANTNLSVKGTEESSKKSRRRKKSKTGLPFSRLLSYGKVELPKHKKKTPKKKTKKVGANCVAMHLQ